MGEGAGEWAGMLVVVTMVSFFFFFFFFFLTPKTALQVLPSNYALASNSIRPTLSNTRQVAHSPMGKTDDGRVYHCAC